MITNKMMTKKKMKRRQWQQWRKYKLQDKDWDEDDLELLAILDHSILDTTPGMLETIQCEGV